MQTQKANPQTPLTRAEAKARFHRTGRSVKSFAQEHGFNLQLVYMVLSGYRPGLRGQSHEIAVRLGIKEGVIEGEHP